MTTIPVPLLTNPYDIHIESGGLRQLGDYLAAVSKVGRVLVVSNPTIFKHYGTGVVASLKSMGFEVAHCLVPAGERYKTPATVAKIHNAALEHRLERASVIVALGGGVVGDMAGFAAATWLRGIKVVQVPTTLLAMVDAAIGGKTGVNHPQGKNLIGAFHQPSLVLIDPETLATLPSREFRSAIAEVIKYAVIWDLDLFERLEAERTLSRPKGELLQLLLERSCLAKAAVVAADEREGGLRAILNYGHTVGHAIESATHYHRYRHGEGVGLGIVAAGRIAVGLGLWSAELAKRQEALLIKAGLPVAWANDIATDQLIALMGFDKKVEAGQVRFVLPEAIGKVRISADVPPALVRQVLDACGGQSKD
jgi:3-dehydroquinate synthase